jgi:hemerythrin superfamily protein
MRRDRSLIPLSHQHQHGLALCVLIDRGLKKDPSRENVDRLSQMAAEMARIELLSHFQVEEEVLFPAVRPLIEDGELIGELIAQHREMERMIEDLARQRGEPRKRKLIAFGGLLNEHIRTEERRLFQEIQAKAGEFRLAQLGREIEDRVHKLCPSTRYLPWEIR